MNIAVLGVNRFSCALPLREAFARACLGLSREERLDPACILLATCDRTEIYFSAPDLKSAHSRLLDVLGHQIPLYAYFDADCFHHLARVTAGLESAVIGETEIQRQVKVAYERGSLCESLPSCMHFLFQKCLKIGKQARSFFPIHPRSSLERMILDLTRRFFDSNFSLLFVGNSEINRKIHACLGLSATVCTRSPMQAQGFEKVVSWEELDSWQHYDMVISATEAADYALTAPSTRPECRTRLIVDLSLPRIVDPAIKAQAGITLLNIEEMESLLDKNKRQAPLVLQEVEEMIRQEVIKQLDIFERKESFACVS